MSFTIPHVMLPYLKFPNSNKSFSLPTIQVVTLQTGPSVTEMRRAWVGVGGTVAAVGPNDLRRVRETESGGSCEEVPRRTQKGGRERTSRKHLT